MRDCLNICFGCCDAEVNSHFVLGFKEESRKKESCEKCCELAILTRQQCFIVDGVWIPVFAQGSRVHTVFEQIIWCPLASEWVNSVSDLRVESTPIPRERNGIKRSSGFFCVVCKLHHSQCSIRDCSMECLSPVAEAQLRDDHVFKPVQRMQELWTGTYHVWRDLTCHS